MPPILILKTVNLLNNLPVLINIAKKDVKNNSILGSNLSKSKMTILIEPKNLDKFKKWKNYPNWSKSQKTILDNNLTYVRATKYLTSNTKIAFI